MSISGIAYALPFGVSEIAKHHELTAEGAKNHGPIVSEAAKQQSRGAPVNYHGSLSSTESVFSPQTVFHRKVFQSQRLCYGSAQDFSSQDCGTSGHVGALFIKRIDNIDTRLFIGKIDGIEREAHAFAY